MNDLRKAISVVIVDDNEADHFFIRNSINEHGSVSSRSFYNGEDFINFLKSLPSQNEFPDIVILDINMPGLSGFEVYEAARKVPGANGIYFTILSTSITPADLEKCKELNLSCHVKPFSMEHYGALLENIISAFTEYKSKH